MLAQSFWQHLVSLGDSLGADYWAGVAAAVALGLSTAISTGVMWFSLRDLERRTLQLELARSRPPSPRSPEVVPSVPPAAASPPQGTPHSGEEARLMEIQESTAALDDLLRRAEEQVAALRGSSEQARTTHTAMAAILEGWESQHTRRRELLEHIEKHLRERQILLTTDILRAEGRHLQLADMAGHVERLLASLGSLTETLPARQADAPPRSGSTRDPGLLEVIPPAVPGPVSVA